MEAAASSYKHPPSVPPSTDDGASDVAPQRDTGVPEASPADAGAEAAALQDAATQDAGNVDASASDAGAVDTGALDAENDSQLDSAPEATPAIDAGAACLAPGADCTGTPNDCCSGLCSSPTTIPGGHAFCAAHCVTGSDCASGCCAPETNTGVLACAPRGFCSATCSPSGGACVNTYDCCANNTCVTTNGGSCAANCVLNTDCVSGCCAPVGGSAERVCSAPQFCP